MRIRSAVTFVLPFLALTPLFAASHTLFKNGKTGYSIVVSSDATPSEKFAAGELASHLFEISGAEFPVVGESEGRRGHRIIVGLNADSRALLKVVSVPAPEDETFTYAGCGGDIVIYGGNIRGTMYGVYSFLEREFGCQWFTTDFSMVPQRSSWSFDSLSHSETPYIQDRFLYFTAGYDLVWSARNRNNYMPPPDVEGKAWTEPPIRGFDAGHTFNWCVPQRKYWQTHPEYYSEIDGRRINGETQLCLTNPDVLRLCIDNVRERMRKGEYTIVDCSQNDSSPYCHCSRCLAKADSLGNVTDLLLWFVNQVADSVRDEFPDRYVGTFSYEWSIPAPENVVPRDNVVIRLCTYDNCLAHPLERCDHNVEWIENMKKWSGLAPHLYIWHYIASFRQYNVPFPFIENLVPDIKLFKRMNAIGVLEEGEYEGPGGNFQEFKTWIIAKLLWNPDLDVEQLTQTFFEGYYRESSAAVREYFDYTQTLADSGIHGFCWPKHYESQLYSEDFIHKALELAVKAENSCTDEVTRRHVLLATLQAHYLYARFHPMEALQDGTLEHIKYVYNLCGIKVFSEWGDVITLYNMEYMLKYDAGIFTDDD